MQGEASDYIKRDIKVNSGSHAWFNLDEMWDGLALSRSTSSQVSWRFVLALAYLLLASRFFFFLRFTEAEHLISLGCLIFADQV